MKLFFILAVLALTPGVGFTQGAALESEVDSELEQLYTTSKPARRAAPVQAQQAQPIYILNQATPNAVANTNTQVQTQQIQKQPTTYVEASPLVESRADQMRKTRVDAEANTETKIVEKLEQSRLDDEKRRADVLFGNKFDQLNQKHNQQEEQQPVAAPVVAPVVAPAPPVQPVIIQQVTPPPVEQKDLLTREAIREELQSALKAEVDAPVTSVETKYFSALIGMPDHPDSTNIRGNYSLGATFGTKYDDTYAVEGTFVFSNYTMNPIYHSGFYAPDMDLNQYSASVGMKYFMMSGMVKPFVGGLGQYTYRTYQWANTGYANNGYYGANNSNETSTSSHAIDLGINVGADVVFNPKFTVGFDYRYFFNLSSRRNQSAFVYQPYYGTALEQLNSTLVSVALKVQF